MLKKLGVLAAALVMGLSTLTFQPAPAEARRGGAIIGGLIAGALIGGAIYSHRRHHRSYGYYNYGYAAPVYGYSYRPAYYSRWGHRHHRGCRHW